MQMWRRFFIILKESVSLCKIKVKKFKLHNTEQYYNSWIDIRLAEASDIHQVLVNSRGNDYSKEVKNMLVEGTKVRAMDYIHSMRIIKEIRKEFLLLLRHKVDVIIVPTTVIPAPKLNEDSVIVNKGFLINIREALLRNTIIFNSIGFPAVSIPLGLTRKDRLPVGLQIIGPPNGDNLVLSIAHQFKFINDKILKCIPTSIEI